MPMHKYLLLTIGCFLASVSQAQISRLGNDIEYKVSTSGQFGTGDHTPFWQSANQQGLSSVTNNSAYIRASIQRDTETDSLRYWRIGYGADLVAPFGYQNHFIVQQTYFEAAYRLVRLSVGQKERWSEMKNRSLSTGGMILGNNARPLPQVRLETSDFFVIPRTKNWLFLKGHLAYGWFTDNKWQRDFNAGNKNATYTANSLYHSKAGYVRIGNLEKFPLILTGGVEMACQFGGTIWNRGIKGEDENGAYHFKNGIKEYLQAFVPSGSDVTDGENPNVMGNNVGSYLARVDYIGKGWSISAYGEHMFEDHSMMGFDFAWKDFLWGGEVKLPRNRFVSTILYEYMSTKDQSGPILLFLGNKVHNIGGQDNYYNHNIYGAYQHAGQVMGNPCLLSPIYNNDGKICTYDNRVRMNHIGLSGTPHNDVQYRILLTHEKSLGTYFYPHENPKHGTFLLLEATYSPHKIKGLNLTASYGQNKGALLGDSKGGMITLSYKGQIKGKH